MGNRAFAWSRVEHGLAADRPDASLELRGVYYWAEDTGELTLCLTDTTGTAGWQYVTTGTSPSMVKLPVRGRITTPAAYTATRRATTGLPTYLTANAVGALGAHDGVTYVAGDRCLLADGTAYAGIYVVTNPGAAGAAFVLTRAADFDVSSEVVSGVVVPVSEGTVAADKLYVLTTNGAITLDTTALAFAVAAVTVGNESAHTHTSGAFTGTAATTAETNHVTGTGFATAGQVVTTTDNQTLAIDECAGMWLITAAQAPCLIVSHPACTGAPAVFTVFGLAPTTAAEAYRVLRAPTPAGASAATGAGSAHNHSIT